MPGVPVQFFYDDAPFGATGLVPAVGFAERPSDSYVVDFLDFRVWPVFNLADTYISVGVGLYLLSMLRDKKKS